MTLFSLIPISSKLWFDFVVITTGIYNNNKNIEINFTLYFTGLVII